jgi:DNA-binding NtrC family response regulator
MDHTVLVIDDDASLCELLAERLEASRFTVVWTTQPERAESLIGEQPFDVVLTDLRMQHVDGIELCARLVRKYPELPVVVMTAFGSVGAAVSAMRAGARDFIIKPHDLALLTATLERAMADAVSQREARERQRVTAERQREHVDAEVATPELVALDEIERRHILRVLEAVQGNKSRAAQVLGLDRKTLYRRLERYGAAPDGAPSTSV